MMQGLTLLALGSPVAAGAAPKGIDTRNSAGLDVNKKSRFEDLDISSAINKPVGAPVEEPPAQKQAPTQSAIFADDALGYAFAVPPSFQGQSKAIDNGGQIIAFTDVSLNPPDITKRITLVAQPVPVPPCLCGFASLKPRPRPPLGPRPACCLSLNVSVSLAPPPGPSHAPLIRRAAPQISTLQELQESLDVDGKAVRGAPSPARPGPDRVRRAGA
jgi:hypothetical protein